MSAIRGHHQLLMRASRADYRSLTLSFAPTFYYPLDETSASDVATDISGNGYAAAHHNVTLMVPSPINAGTAVSYNGINAYTQLPTPTTNVFAPGLSDWSVAMMCRWTSASLGVIFGIFNVTTPFPGPTIFANFDGEGEATGRIHVRDRLGASYGVTSSLDVMNDGVWRHLVCQRRTISPGNVRMELYINGALANYTTLPGVTNLTGHNLAQIGSRANQQRVAGSLDEVAYWKYRSFSAAEVAAIYAATGL